MSRDTPGGTGDHEHYYEYLGTPLSARLVYDSKGVSYTNCEKKAIFVKQRNIGTYWWRLAKEFTLEWMAICKNQAYAKKHESNYFFLYF